MEFTIREMTPSDRMVWAEMRAALWPEDPVEEHAKEIDEFFASGDVWGLIAQNTNGVAIGFAELAIRKYANGCTSRPVPFLEGIWINAEFRRQGVGTRLVDHAARSLAARGFREICSDAKFENHTAVASHLGWGFFETEKVVYFRKPIHPIVR